MPRGPVLTVVITSVNEGLDKGLTEAEQKLGKFGKVGGKIAGVAKVAAPIVGITAAAAKLASASDKAATNSKLWADAMTNLGVSAKDLNGPFQDAIASSKDLAFSGQASKDALLALQTATGNTATSISLLSTAQDIARLSGADLETAATALAKAWAGQDRQLRALVPGMAETENGYQTIAMAAEIAEGSAQTFGDSTAAAGIKAKAELKGLAVAIGSAVKPAFDGLLAVVTPLLGALTTLVEALLPVLIPMIQAVARAFEIAAKAIAKVVDLVAKLIGKVRELLAPLDKVTQKLKEISPFKGQMQQVANGTFGVMGLSPMAATNATGAVGGGGGGGVTINIYGDPSVIEARVTKALRDYARRNGAAAVFTPERA